MAILMDDGAEFIAGPGDITSLPSGHDAWVVGDEPAVVVDWYGASNYAKPKSGAAIVREGFSDCDRNEVVRRPWWAFRLYVFSPAS